MHMADALLSPVVGTTFWAGALGAVSYCSKKLKESMDERMVPLMGVLGAFIFAAQMINFTIPGTGSSGHLGGGMILAIILGPYAAFLVMASVLTAQAFFFADGGLLALGCNIWNLGIYPCFIAYPLIYKPIAKADKPGRIIIAAIVSSVLSLQLGALSVVVQTVLSGRSDLPFRTFVILMQPIHLAIGLVEGLITVGVVNSIRAARPEILESSSSGRPPAADISLKKVFLGLLVVAALTGGALSWFASVNPDGLEWSIEKTAGTPELQEEEKGISYTLREIQKATAFLPDYGFRKPEGSAEDASAENNDEPWPDIDTGTSLSGVAGSLIVLAMIFLVGFTIRSMKKRTRLNP